VGDMIDPGFTPNFQGKPLPSEVTVSGFDIQLRVINMNPYEVRVRDAIKDINDSIKRVIDNKSQNDTKIEELNTRIKSCQVVLDTISDDTVKEVLHKEIKDLVKSRDSIISDNARLTIRHQDLIGNMNFIQRSICPHENSTFDHTDYHKNEDFHKCNLCGAIR
jgi:hypothetical protein